MRRAALFAAVAFFLLLVSAPAAAQTANETTVTNATATNATATATTTATPISETESTDSVEETNGSVITPVVINESGSDLDELGEDCEEPRTIGSDLVLCSKKLTSDNVAVLTFRADRHMRITLTDGAALWSGGEMNRIRQNVRPNEVTTVRMEVETYESMAGVSVDTGQTIEGVPIVRPKPGFLPGSPQSEDPAIAALTVFTMFAVAIPVSYIGMRRYTGGVHREF